MIPVTMTPSSITFMLDNRHRHVAKSHANFEAVKRQLRVIQQVEGGKWHDEAELFAAVACELDVLRGLVDIPTFIATISEGRVSANATEVRFDGKVVHGHVAERLLGLLAEGFDVRPLMKFLDRLAGNPIETSRDELLNWLEHSKLPLTEDGCFVAYKFVDADYKDQHTHTIDNSFGAVIPRLDPAKVNTDRHMTCADSGYHFCSFDYLSGSHPHVMVVKIAPEDVASFPYDSEIAKGRCMFYEVIGEVPADELRERRVEDRPIYNGTHASDPSPYQDDRQDEDEDEEGADEDHSGHAAHIDDDGHQNHGGAGEDAGETLNRATMDAVTDALVDAAAPPETLGEAVAKAAARPTGRQTWVMRLKGIEYDGRALTPKRLGKLITKHGQRQVSRMTGIPRSTLQDWLK